MAITVVAHVAVSGDSGGTSAARDTTGATLLVASLSYDGTGAGNISDSKGNTWTALTRYSPSDRSEKLFYAVNPTVGSGHTFSTTTGVSTLCVGAFAATDTSSPYDSPQENGGTASSGSTILTGNVTPSVDNCLLVTGCLDGGGGPDSVDAYFTELENVPLSGGHYYGGALAYAVQTTATTKQATWTFSGATVGAASIAVFKPAGAVSGGVGPVLDGGALTHGALIRGGRLAA